MKEFRVKNKGTARLFSSGILEWLTRTNFIIPVLLYYFLSVLFLVLSLDNGTSFPDVCWLFICGWLFFTLTEYFTHRFIFHFHAVTVKEQQVQYSIHGVHHEFPRDKDRLVMPLVLSVFFSAGFFFLFNGLMGNSGFPFFSGFLSGYSSYLVIHYAVHARKPPKNLLRYFWRHHSLHHYASVNSAFSVSMPLWDYLFNTMPSKKERLQADERLPDSLPS